MTPPNQREIRAPAADVRGYLAAAPIGPTLFEIAPPLPPSRSGRRTFDPPYPSTKRIFQRPRPQRSVERVARVDCPPTRGNRLRALRRSARVAPSAHCAAECRAPRPAPERV